MHDSVNTAMKNIHLTMSVVKSYVNSVVKVIFEVFFLLVYMSSIRYL